MMIKQRAAKYSILPLVLILATPVLARDGVRVTPDRLSFLDEPLALNLYGFTVTYNQLIDVPVIYDSNGDKAQVMPRTSLRGRIERQLVNSITVGASYSANYDGTETEEFDSRWSVDGSGSWGTFSVGEVSDIVELATQRWPGTGNAKLDFDGPLGGLGKDELAAAHQLRLSAYTLNGAIDINGKSDFGVTYERPEKLFDIRLTGRYTNGDFTAQDGQTVFDTNGIGLVGQLEYGSFAGDIGLGVEHFSTVSVSGWRTYVSAGLHYKVRRLTVSVEGHLGASDSGSEQSAALGARYDIARGLSVNLGYNYAKADTAIGGIVLQNVEKSDVISSLRYEF